MLLISGDKMDIEKAIDEAVDKTNEVPGVVEKATTEIRNRDIQCEDFRKRLNIHILAYAKSMKKLTKEQKRKYKKEIDDMYVHSTILIKEKVDIANGLYDFFDAQESSSNGENSKKRGYEGACPDVEMVIDPNEPIYCSCRGVSSDDMVCCDNEGCEIQWFHYACMGLTVKIPKLVKWYCKACRPNHKHMPNQWNYKTNQPPNDDEGTKDPDEPIYCICRDVSHGKMVCCDNESCEIEWFHFVCMGLTVQVPKYVAWYCEACRPNHKDVPYQWNYETNQPPDEAPPSPSPSPPPSPMTPIAPKKKTEKKKKNKK